MTVATAASLDVQYCVRSRIDWSFWRCTQSPNASTWTLPYIAICLIFSLTRHLTCKTQLNSTSIYPHYLVLIGLYTDSTRLGVRSWTWRAARSRRCSSCTTCCRRACTRCRPTAPRSRYNPRPRTHRRARSATHRATETRREHVYQTIVLYGF